MSKVLRCTVIASLLFVAASLTAHGDEKYPTKPIRLIVPMAAGGGVDGLARVIAQQVGESLGQSVVVDNRTGGGGIIGVGMAIRATPDGYTLIMVNASYGANPALYPQLPYDSVNGIQPIIQLGRSGLGPTYLRLGKQYPDSKSISGTVCGDRRVCRKTSSRNGTAK